jgi:hypothetical protein
MFARSSSKAMNIIQANTMMRMSILRTSLFSSRHVQRAGGSKRWIFSLVQNVSYCTKTRPLDQVLPIRSGKIRLGDFWTVVDARL